MNEDRRTYSVEGVQVCIFLLLFRCSMLSEYSHTLGISPINRNLQRSFVVVIFETSIHLVITQELRHDGGAVVVSTTSTHHYLCITRTFDPWRKLTGIGDADSRGEGDGGVRWVASTVHCRAHSSGVVCAAVGLLPEGNTGGANVSPFKPMPISQANNAILDKIKHAQS